jgi:hypothetical protein
VDEKAPGSEVRDKLKVPIRAGRVWQKWWMEHLPGKLKALREREREREREIPLVTYSGK